MAFFDDMNAALVGYPVANVQLEIVEVDFPDTALNANEQGSFRVRVSNTGPLNLTGVTLRIRGQNGATVANNGALAQFESEFVTQELPAIGGHLGSQLTAGGKLRFTAPAEAQDSKTLIMATLETWNADLNHILIGHSGALRVTPKGTFAAEVVAS